MLNKKQSLSLSQNGAFRALSYSFIIFFSLITFQAVIAAKIQKKKNSPFLIHQKTKISFRLQNQISSLSDIQKHLKIWIYFTDKGVSTQVALQQKLAEARKRLEEHCLWRRQKVRHENHLIDYADFKLYPPYVEKIRSHVRKIRVTSRWLNAVSAEANASQIQELEKLAFIQKIDLVLSFQREQSIFSPPEILRKKIKDPQIINYGDSFRQLEQINVLPLHQLEYSGKGVRVCLLDTGFRKSHEVFQQANIIAEWDFVNGDDDVQQDLSDSDDYSDSHGTGAWSCLGGYKLGELIGPAYGADFILGKTETSKFEQPIEEDYWVAGIEWAESLGAEVVSSSLGYIDWYTFEDMDGETAVTTIAADRAVDLGVVVVNAVGNERDDPWGHLIAPADGFNVIAVGAVNASGILASFSSPGPTSDGRIKPEVCALGVYNWIAANQEDGSDYYWTGSGTSFATPLVGGVVTLLLEIHRNWTPIQIRKALQSTASQSSNPDNDYGWGIVNASLAASLEFSVPKVHSYSIDDDNIGKSSGNGNGKAEAGETIEIYITLKNESQAPAISLECFLSSTHPDIKVSSSKVTFPSLSSSSTETSNEPFVVDISLFFLGHHAVFRIKAESPTSIAMYETLRIPISR